MKTLILALATASGLALAAPAAADHHGGKDQHAMMHKGMTPDEMAAMFLKHHGEQLSAAINHPTRKEDRARDAFRHPAETLAFFHVGPHMKVGEYAPGGGWYSRLLGHYLGGEGQLVGIFANPLTASAVLAPGFAEAFAKTLGPDLLVAIPNRNQILVFSKQDQAFQMMGEFIISGYLSSTYPVSREIFSLENGCLRSLGVLQ